MMRKIAIIVVPLLMLVALSASHVWGQQPQSMERKNARKSVAAADNATHFVAVDVFVDSGDAPLAAYQFELKAEVGDSGSSVSKAASTPRSMNRPITTRPL